MKIITHNKLFVYEVDSKSNIITLKYRNLISGSESESNLYVVTGRDIISIFTTPNDRYLLAMSDSEKVIYVYSINQTTGELMLMIPPKTTIQCLQDLLTKLYVS
jgi:hypothetical protein